MGKFRISVSGADELIAHLRNAQKLAEVKDVVKKNTANLHRKSVKNAQFTKGYSTGATRQSIKSDILNDGLAGKVSAGTHYSGYLEVGTRKMEAQPFIGPAFEEVSQEFHDDLNEVMK